MVFDSKIEIWLEIWRKVFGDGTIFIFFLQILLFQRTVHMPKLLLFQNYTKMLRWILYIYRMVILV
jgi:hypothetical protein